jgi:hypothetical protein
VIVRKQAPTCAHIEDVSGEFPDRDLTLARFASRERDCFDQPATVVEAAKHGVFNSLIANGDLYQRRDYLAPFCGRYIMAPFQALRGIAQHQASTRNKFAFLFGQ